MTRRVWVGSVSRADAVRATLAAWARDLRGATVVQFAVVLPVLVLLFFGTWSLYTVYSAHQTLCEATWEASRYLQVESPMFPSPDDDTTGEFCYTSGWENIAAQIINTSLVNNRLVSMDGGSGGGRIR